MTKLALPFALVALLLLSGCAALDAPADTPPLPTQTPASPADPNVSTLDLVAVPSNLAGDEQPHDVRIESERDATVDVTIDVVRDGTESTRTVRLAPNTTVVGTLDYRANYELTVTAGAQSATETLLASMFDCNSSSTTFTVTGSGVTVRTVSTTMGCS